MADASNVRHDTIVVPERMSPRVSVAQLQRIFGGKLAGHRSLPEVTTVDHRFGVSA
jgi:hypothetical protein